jgi:hypothetical protein
VGFNVDSKTFNEVGGGGINSPTHQTSRYQGVLRMGAPESPVRHRCTNGRFQRLVLTASRWAVGTPDSLVWPLKFIFSTRCSRVFSGVEALPRGLAGPTARGRTGQFGAHRTVRCPKTETLTSFSFGFSNPFSF